MTEIEIDGGKYVLGTNDWGELFCLRHGEPWLWDADFAKGSKMLIALVHEHADLENELRDERRRRVAEMERAETAESALRDLKPWHDQVMARHAEIRDVEAQLAAMTERAESAEARLESCRQVEACSKAFHDLAIRERDFERVRADRLEGERDAAMARLAAMTARAEMAEADRAASIDAVVARATASLTDRLVAAEERAEKAERELDEEHRERMSEANVSAVRYAMIHEEAKNCHRLIAVASLCELLRYDAAERDLAEARARLAAMHRRAQLAENPTTHTRCEATFQRKRAEWWRGEAKRLGWTPDYPELREDPPSDERLDYESSSLLLLSTWARKVMMRPKNRAKGLPDESILKLLRMAWHELSEARWAISGSAPIDDILAELGEAAACIAFAMREIEKQRKA